VQLEFDDSMSTDEDAPSKKKRKSWKNHRVDRDEGMYACDQCNKVFSKQSSLARHKYEHSGTNGIYSNKRTNTKFNGLFPSLHQLTINIFNCGHLMQIKIDAKSSYRSFLHYFYLHQMDKKGSLTEYYLINPGYV